MTPSSLASPLALEGTDLCVTLGHGAQSRTVLHGVTVRAGQGRWVALVGPNGAGKSTLLGVLAGLIPHAGSVRLWGRPASAIDPRSRARTVAWMAQSGMSDMGADDLAVRDVVMLGRLPHQGWLTAPTPDDHRVVDHAMRQTQVDAWRDRRFGALSGGERQRVLLARALAVDAPVMLMDEPLAHLDPPHQADWVQVVRGLVQEGRTVVSVLHDLTMALQADDLWVMRAGHVIHAGPVAEPAAREALVMAFDQRLQILPLEGRWVAWPLGSGARP